MHKSADASLTVRTIRRTFAVLILYSEDLSWPGWGSPSAGTRRAPEDMTAAGHRPQ